MGLKNWILTKFLGIDLNSVKLTQSAADDYLKTATLLHAETLKTAQKINKAKLLSLQEKRLRQELKNNLDEEDDDAEEDDDDEEDDGQNITNNLIQTALDAFLKKGQGTATAAASDADLYNDADAALKKLNPEQLKKLKGLGFF